MLLYMYIAPGKGQTTPCRQNFDATERPYHFWSRRNSVYKQEIQKSRLTWYIFSKPWYKVELFTLQTQDWTHIFTTPDWQWSFIRLGLSFTPDWYCSIRLGLCFILFLYPVSRYTPCVGPICKTKSTGNKISHTWVKNIPFYGCLRFVCLGLLVSFYDKIAISNCQSLLYIETQGLLLQHLFGCNCIYHVYKHFAETKKTKRCSFF